MVTKMDPYEYEGDPLLISLVKKISTGQHRSISLVKKTNERTKEKYIKKAPGEPRKPRSQKSFVWNHFTVSDSDSGKHCLCRHCGKTMVMYDSGTTSHLKEHLLKHHNDEVDQEDKVEKRAVGSFVWNHFTKDKDTGNCECQHCGRSITTNNGGTTNLRNHVKKFHPEKYDETATTPYMRASAAAVENPGDLDTEKKRKYRETEKRKRRMKSMEKKRKKMQKSFARNHFTLHTDNSHLICRHCEKVYDTITTSNGERYHRDHILIHHSDKVDPEILDKWQEVQQCSHCDKVFFFTVQRKRHESLHYKDKICGYDNCGKIFALKCGLRRHERTHTGEKPYGCKTCGNKFAQSQQLKSHTRVHTGETPYQCYECGKNFKFQSSWNNHKCVQM